MLRTTIIALAATAALGAAALAPSAASARAWHAGRHGGWHGHFLRPGIGVYAGPIYGGCWLQRWIATPYGPVLRWVNRCY